MNYAAGVKAKNSTAYESALKYFYQSLDLLSNTPWIGEYELTLNLYSEVAEAEYLSGNIAKGEKEAAQVLENAKTILDKMRVYLIQFQFLNGAGKGEDSLGLALPVLKELGVSLPTNNPGQPQIVLELIKTKKTQGFKKIESLKDLPAMVNPRKIAAMRILALSFGAAVFSRPSLAPIIAFKMVQLSIKFGNSPISPFGYSGYGMILTGVLQDIDSGDKFNQLALFLLEKFNAKVLAAKVFFLDSWFLGHWKTHMRESLPHLQEGYQAGREFGDLEFASYCIGATTFISYGIGENLKQILKDVRKNLETVRNMNQEQSVGFMTPYYQMIMNLQGLSETRTHLKGDGFDEEKLMPMYL